MYCTNCSKALDSGDRFCTLCGQPVMPGHRLSTRRNPFMQLRSRTLVFLAIFSIPAAFVVFEIANGLSIVDLDDPTADLIAMNTLLYGTLVAWMLWQFRRHRIGIRRIMGRLPTGYNWFPALGILFATLLFSIGSLIVLSYVISLVAPGLVESLLEVDVLAPMTEPASAAAFMVVSTASLLVVAPFVEELFYRGVLINRWGIKWGLRAAIVASAVLFGIGHLIDVVGATMFGIIAAILYIKTRTLLVPMALHFVNNAFVVVAGFVVELAEPVESFESVGTVEEIQSAVFGGLVLLALSAPILVWYIRRNWPRANDELPYEASVEEGYPVGALEDDGL